MPVVVTRSINRAKGGGSCSFESRDGSGNNRIYKYRFFSIDKCLNQQLKHQKKKKIERGKIESKVLQLPVPNTNFKRVRSLVSGCSEVIDPPLS